MGEIERSSSVKRHVNDQPLNSHKVETNATCKILNNQIINDDSAIQMGLEDTQVVFVKHATTANALEQSQDLKTENTITRIPDTNPTDKLLSVVMNNMENNMDNQSSVASFDANLEISHSYLYPSSMVSCGTENTVVGSVNEESEQNDNVLERPLRPQRDSSGSIRAAVARRKQNITHRSAAQKREANLAVVLVSSVTMFLICHAPRIFANL